MTVLATDATRLIEETSPAFVLMEAQTILSADDPSAFQPCDLFVAIYRAARGEPFAR